MEKKTGSLTKGKLADIIAVQNKPFDDVNRLEHATFVMKEDVVYKNEHPYLFPNTRSVCLILFAL